VCTLSGDRISSKQLRDDLMTLLIAGHETTAAVLTWTLYCLLEHPDVMRRVQAEVRLWPRISGVPILCMAAKQGQQNFPNLHDK
jgi:cytochrome P450